MCALCAYCLCIECVLTGSCQLCLGEKIQRCLQYLYCTECQEMISTVTSNTNLLCVFGYNVEHPITFAPKK